MNKFLSNLKQTPGFYTFWYFLILQGVQQTWSTMPADKKAVLLAAFPWLQTTAAVMDSVWWFVATLAAFVILRATPQQSKGAPNAPTNQG